VPGQPGATYGIDILDSLFVRCGQMTEDSVLWTEDRGQGTEDSVSLLRRSHRGQGLGRSLLRTLLAAFPQ
jgi:hypothetical protein